MCPIPIHSLHLWGLDAYRIVWTGRVPGHILPWIDSSAGGGRRGKHLARTSPRLPLDFWCLRDGIVKRKSHLGLL